MSDVEPPADRSGDSLDDVHRRVNRGLAWVGAAASLIAVLEVLGTLLILRFWVTPKQYGIATAVVSIFGALELASELGVAASIIGRRVTHTQAQLSTLYWINIAGGVVLYVALWFSAPLLARLHGEPIITDVTRVFGVAIVIRAAYAMPQAMLKRELRFKELSLVRMVANLADFGVKLAVAMAGGGVWAFVVGPIARYVVYATGVPLILRWRPSLVFEPATVRDDIAFGLRSTGGEMIFAVYSNLDYQVVGAVFGPQALGIYRAAYELVLEPVRFISGVVTGVAFPAFARLRSSPPAVARQFIAFCRQNVAIVLGYVAVLLVTAPDALTVLLGTEYRAAATSMRLMAVVAVLRGLSHLGPPLFDGLGRPDLTLRYQIAAGVTLSTLFLVAALGLGPTMGATSVALAWAVGYPVAFAMMLRQIFSVVELRGVELVRALLPLVVAAAVASGVGVVLMIVLADAAPALRFGVVTATMVAILFVVVARWLLRRRAHRDEVAADA